MQLLGRQKEAAVPMLERAAWELNTADWVAKTIA
jgi:hypothetical protein